jgi:membrane protease YdiL (CAAX protease family)
MSFIANVFWNADEKRLRAFWRMALQGAVWFGLLVVLQIIITIVVVIVLTTSGAVSPEALSDLAIWDEIISSPVVSLVLGISNLLVVFTTAGLAGRFLDRRRFADFGFHFSKDWWIDFGFGLALGAFSLALIFAIERAAGWITITGAFATHDPSTPFPLAILAPLALFVMVGIEEELLCRGYQLTNIAEGMNWKRIGPRWAIVAATIGSSMIFGTLHALNPNATLVSTLYLMVAGVALAFGYTLTGELAIPIGYHITWNFFEGNVFGFPVSGMDFRSATFIAIEQGGPPLWTGGPFGPEAGLLCLAVEVLGMALIVLWVRLRYQRFGLHAAIAEPPMRTDEAAVGENIRLQEL